MYSEIILFDLKKLSLPLPQLIDVVMNCLQEVFATSSKYSGGDNEMAIQIPRILT